MKAHQKRQNIALFDFDGTLTHDDMFTPFVTHSTSGVRKIISSLLIAPFYALYKLRLIPAWQMRPIASFFSFAFRKIHHLEALGRQYAHNEVEMNIRPEARSAIAKHRQNGDKIVVVSASLDVYLRPWCEANGFELLCSELTVKADRYTGFYQHGDCSRATKAERVSQRYPLEHFDKVYAYGDTTEDLALLSLADEAIYQWQSLSIENMDKIKLF